MKWKIIESKTAFKNHFFQITQDTCEKSNGSVVESYYTIHRPPVAVIGTFTEKNEIILINQYRHPVQSVDIELPAGYIEDHEKDIQQAAKRELLEETGYKAEKLVKIHESFASAGLMSNNIHFFIGFNAKKVSEPQLDDNEELEVRVTPWKEALKLLEKEKIKDMASVTGILLIKQYLKKNPLK
jgi:8-oxo-dGTP pyrophosphatase MutT (NUDIX family)